MADFPRITQDPAIMGGRACIRDTHVTVATVVALLSSGRSQEDIFQMFPALTQSDIQEALAYAVWAVDGNAKSAGDIERSRLGAAESKPESPWRKSHLFQRQTSLVRPTPLGQPVTAPEPAGSSEEKSPAAPDATSAATPEQPAIADEPQPIVPVEEPLPVEIPEESLELYHPSYPDQPTVVISKHGLYDRRWSTYTVAWSDIEEIQRPSGEKTIQILLRNPHYYISSMPLMRRLGMHLRLLLNRRTFYLDSASLGIRTKDLYITTKRLWLRHKGKVRFRKKRRMRVGEPTGRATAWTRESNLWNTME